MAGLDIQTLLQPGALEELPVSSEQIYRGALFDIRADQAKLPDGTLGHREYTVHPGAALIIPLFDDGTVLLERQYRYANKQVFIEFPAGKIDAGENPLACAKRELLEETGYTASEWRFLTAMNPVISYSTEKIYIYLARHLSKREAKLDQGEFIETIRVPVLDVMNWIRAGHIPDAKTQLAMFWLEKAMKYKWQTV